MCIQNKNALWKGIHKRAYKNIEALQMKNIFTNVFTEEKCFFGVDDSKGKSLHGKGFLNIWCDILISVRR